MLIALLSDFGTRDPYVASRKGVIASLTQAPVVDLTHEIAPFDVFEAAWFLKAVLPYYPGDRSCVIAAVVDPGVGSARRILAADVGGRIVLAPDNGLLSLHVDASSVVHSVENEDLFLPAGSSTFHGRDRFAPVAAVLAEGLSLDQVGPRIEVSVMERLDYESPVYGPIASGRIVAIDRFGNCVTDLEAARTGPLDGKVLETGSRRIDRTARTYAEAPAGTFMLVGSRGTVEISIANGSAAEVLHLARFDRVAIRAK